MSTPTPLEIAAAARKTADEIQNHSFPRTYGMYARRVFEDQLTPSMRGNDGYRADPNADNAVSWCALGRFYHHLGCQDMVELSLSPKPILATLNSYTAGIWPLWDAKLIHSAACNLRLMAQSIENHILNMEAPTRTNETAQNPTPTTA